MENPSSKPDNSEESLIKLYREVSGASEMSARSVLIHLDSVISEKPDTGGKASTAGESGSGPAR